MSGPQLAIDGQWLEAHTAGDLEWSTVWPGGSDELSFGVTRHVKRQRHDALVELIDGGERLFAGTLYEPTPGQALKAEGLFRKGEDYAALEGANDAATNVNNAVDAAIGFRRLPWTRSTDLSPQPGVSGAPALDLTQPHTLTEFLDASAKERGEGWGVDPLGNVYISPWPTTPTLHLLPGIDGLGISRDGYACVLFARYLDSSTGTFKTAVAQDAIAEARWGYAERTLREPLGEGVAMTATRAQEIVDGLMAQGQAQIGWTASIEVQYGDVVNEWQQPVALSSITAGKLLRMHGLTSAAADLSGQTTHDVPIARVRHKDGVATIEPRGLVQPFNDVLAGTAA